MNTDLNPHDYYTLLVDKVDMERKREKEDGPWPQRPLPVAEQSEEVGS